MACKMRPCCSRDRKKRRWGRKFGREGWSEWKVSVKIANHEKRDWRLRGMLEQRIKRREGRRLQELEVEKELQGRRKIARGSLKLGEDCEEGGGVKEYCEGGWLRKRRKIWGIEKVLKVEISCVGTEGGGGLDLWWEGGSVERRGERGTVGRQGGRIAWRF